MTQPTHMYIPVLSQVQWLPIVRISSIKGMNMCVTMESLTVHLTSIYSSLQTIQDVPSIGPSLILGEYRNVLLHMFLAIYFRKIPLNTLVRLSFPRISFVSCFRVHGLKTCGTTKRLHKNMLQ